MLFADHAILASETIVRLLAQLNSLQHAASELKLKVHLNKNNIVAFRRGGYIGARERWTYSGVVMPVVNMYKYLGIYFTTRLFHVCL